jgi:hypothetical protein
MDDGRPLKAKVPHILNSILLLLLHLNLKKEEKCREEWAKEIVREIHKYQTLSIEFQVTRDVMRR